MDISDKATEQEELMRDAALRNAAARNDRPRAIGYCHFCRERIAPGAENQLFCDAYCARDWEREKDADKRNGQ